MSRRTQRVASLIRQTLGELLLTKISDPRLDPARTSITHVEVDEDFYTAKVYVSVIGSEKEQRKAVRALKHAHGRLQDLMMDQIRLRHTPVLKFIEDKNFKKTLDTFRVIDEAMDEIREREKLQAEEDETDNSVSSDEPQTPDTPQ